MHIAKLILLIIGVFLCFIAVMILFPVTCIGRWFSYMTGELYDLMDKMMKEGDRIVDANKRY